MNRREFLGTLAALPALGTMPQPAPGARRAIIVGAGLAGLSAALELGNAGWEVSILEARTRPGGRVLTLREPFSDGLYAEAGAARIQDSHQFTLRYVKQLNLTLDPFWPTSGNVVSRVAGQRYVHKQGTAVDLGPLPLPLTEEERKIGLRGGLAKYVFSHLKDLGDPSRPDWLSKDHSRFETSIAELARRSGASAAFASIIALGHDLDGMSALQFLRDAALGAPTRSWFKIRGGNDRLPAGLAALLADHIRYGAPALSIAQDDRAVRVTYRRGEEPVTMTADYVIAAVPAPLMAQIEVLPALPHATRTAYRELGSLRMARAYIQTKRRFWAERGDTGWASTDDPMDIWEYTRDQAGRRGILGAYLSGRIAADLSGMGEGERTRFVLERMERTHPGTREHYEASAFYSWITDPWARGASAEFHPGQLSTFYAALRAPVGRIHFAGEHTSPWTGWMNGALESGHRAAAELIAKTG